MGTWGIGVFENDDAGDWLCELEEAKDLTIIDAALSDALVTDEYLEMPASCNALAAAEVVAAMRGHGLSEMPESMAEYIARVRSEDTEELLKKARMAVTRINSSSELQECWDEVEDSTLWHDSVADLAQRLNSC